MSGGRPTTFADMPKKKKVKPEGLVASLDVLTGSSELSAKVRRYFTVGPARLLGH